MREYNSGNAFSVVYSGSNLEYDVTNGITQLIQYEFKISDIDSENRESDFSNSAIFYATSVPSVISDSDIILENYSGNQIKVLWSYTSSGSDLNIFYYIIYIEGDNYSNKLYVIDKTYYIISNLTYDEKYSVKINYVNVVGKSSNSINKSITISYYPDPPENMQITSIIENVSDITYCDVTFIWEFPNINSEENKSVSGYSISSFLINSVGSIDTNEIVLYEQINNLALTCTVVGKLKNESKNLIQFYSYNPLKSLTCSSLTPLISLKPEKITNVNIISR